MKYESKMVETDLIKHFENALRQMKVVGNYNEKLDLTDDDTLSDYINILFKDFYKQTGLTYSDISTLLVGNWLIQCRAMTPLEYKVIETREIWEPIKINE